MQIRYGLLGIFLVSSVWGGIQTSNVPQDTVQNVEQAQLEAVALALQHEQDANVQKDKKRTMLIAAAISAGIITLAIVSYWLKTRRGAPSAYRPSPPPYNPAADTAPSAPLLPEHSFGAGDPLAACW
jgi:hypothetical protein